MKAALNIVGALLVLMGAVWFLQRINVLPGSFMIGQIRWAICGGIAVAAGVALFFVANREGWTEGARSPWLARIARISRAPLT